MAVAPSASVEKLETRDNALHTESGTWPWHCQRPLRSSKHEITHILRVTESGTWSWHRQHPL
ncbi:hypothetical protein CY34DRAFT_810070, partial [Suillus luteus UH-Slu-Lm8-n1]